jgi:DNA excision repair protein ERCC-2
LKPWIAFILEGIGVAFVYMDYFPYKSLRPHQDTMLDAVYDVISRGNHEILMIDAPTGTGKTSCISSALASAPGKIVVAVRTVSQIDIYIDEVQKIWSETRHKPEIAYLVGKQKICPIEDEFRDEGVYAACYRLREWTKNYTTSRLKKNLQSFYDPSRDSIPEEKPGYRTFCPYYLKSREAFELNGKAHFRRSGESLEVIDNLKKKIIPPSRLQELCQEICPYEIMSLHAKSSQIVIMNYSHLFSPDFQDSILQWLEMVPEELTLIVDEAHNLGDAVRDMSHRVLTVHMLDLAEREVEKFEETLGQSRLEESQTEASWRREGIKIIRSLIPKLRRFLISRLERMQEGEALLDADLFRSFLYNDIEDVDEALSYFSDVAVVVSELNLAESDRENLQGDMLPTLALILLFLRDVETAEINESYLRKVVVTSSNGKKWARLEVSCIDPAPTIRRIVDNVNATVMLSGTFSPLDAYELYCLGEEGRARKLSLPNPFPKENRLLIASKKATTQLEERDDIENKQEISEHIRSLIEYVPGNVAVFFTSYPMMNNYKEACFASARIASKKLYLEPKNTEDIPWLLHEFINMAGLGGGVLLGVCGGKLAEGIDYKGEALNGVAVIGLPLAVFDDIQKEVNAYYIKKYGRTKGILIAYTLPAMNRGLQAAGRVIRSESERGVLIFCDRRFAGDGLGSVRQYLPEWVREELVVVDAKQCRDLIIAKEAEWGQDTWFPIGSNDLDAYSEYNTAPKGERKKSIQSEDLIRALQDKDKSKRNLAIKDLIDLGFHAVDPLIIALRDKHSYVRVLSAYALGEIGHSKAIQPLKQALKDRDSKVRKEAEQALLKISGHV